MRCMQRSVAGATGFRQTQRKLLLSFLLFVWLKDFGDTVHAAGDVWLSHCHLLYFRIGGMRIIAQILGVLASGSWVVNSRPVGNLVVVSTTTGAKVTKRIAARNVGAGQKTAH